MYRVEARHRWQPWALLAILGLAFALRIYSLGSQSLWADEGNSLALATRSLAEIARDSALDIHPPLYYFLLKIWVLLFGKSEIALRSLSVVWGMLLCMGVFLLGSRLYGIRGGMLAGLISAIAPVQIYYAQEARMYLMMASLGTLAAYATWRIMEIDARPSPKSSGWKGAAALYVLSTSAGLYTHYFFPAFSILLNLIYLIGWRERIGWRGGWHLLRRWIGLQTLSLILYLPWLGTGISRLGAWPAGARGLDPLAWLGEAWKTLFLGPAGVEWGWPSLLFLGVFSVGLWPWWRRRRLKDRLVWGGYWLPILGVFIPLVLMMMGGLLSESRLKFLLVASPFMALSLARGIAGPMDRSRYSASGWASLSRLWMVGASVALLVPTVFTLGPYYHSPHLARDDYRSMASYITAVAQPKDAVILNAPGQWDVFSYYYHEHYQGSWPVYRLPAQRPPARGALEEELSALAGQHERLFVLYWATDESDPLGIMENWLDQHAFKGVDVWHGNVRLVIYQTASAMQADVQRLQGEIHFRDWGILKAAFWSEAEMAAGDLLPIRLTWQATSPIPKEAKVFLQLLDVGNNIVGQRDAYLGGWPGAAQAWKPGEQHTEQHAILVVPGTPPGSYRLIAGLYDGSNGQRVPLSEGEADYIELGTLEIRRPLQPLPLAALSPYYRLNRTTGSLHLIGYDRYELGKGPDSSDPLSPGSVLHLVLYWQANARPAGNWQYRVSMRDMTLLDWSNVGGAYATGKWEAGELVRDPINLFLPPDAPAGSHPLRLEIRASDGANAEPALRVGLGSLLVR